MKKKFLITLLSILFLPSCATMMNLMPKVTPAQKAVIFDMAKKFEFSSANRLPKSKLDRIPLKTGQWVVTLSRMKQGDNDVQLKKTKVLSVQGSTVVLEIETYSAANDGIAEISQITLANYPVKAKLTYSPGEYESEINNIKIVKLVSKKGNNPPSEVPQQALMFTQNMSKGIIGNAVRLGEMQETAYESKYIRSSKCYQYNFNVKVMLFTVSGTAVSNSYIPINGIVKIDSNSSTEEVIAFGYKGAKSLL